MTSAKLKDTVVRSQSKLATPFPGRAGSDDDAARRRTDAAAAWLRETFTEARTLNASEVVISFHASPDFDDSPDDPDRKPFEPLLTALEEEAERFARPVLIAHGDDHTYRIDHPVVRSATKRRLECHAAGFTKRKIPLTSVALNNIVCAFA